MIGPLLTVTFALFVLGIWFGAVRTTARVLRYRRMGWIYPQLIWRDLIVQVGLAITFALISVRRIGQAYGVVSPEFHQQVWWIILTSTPAIIAVWTYAYYEVFRLDRGDQENASGTSEPGP